MNDGIFHDMNDNEAVIRAFQEMLRLISQAEGILPLIAVDGKYGDGMEEAVRQYQAQKKLPATGRVDAATWRAAEEDSARIRAANAPPLGITPFPNLSGFEIKFGEHSNLVMLLQIVLEALRIVYDGFGEVPLTGVYDTRTMNAIRCFQSKNNICPCDYVDKDTWNALARQYNLQVERSE